jgi:hypothetical protein
MYTFESFNYDASMAKCRIYNQNGNITSLKNMKEGDRLYCKISIDMKVYTKDDIILSLRSDQDSIKLDSIELFCDEGKIVDCYDLINGRLNLCYLDDSNAIWLSLNQNLYWIPSVLIKLIDSYVFRCRDLISGFTDYIFSAKSFFNKKLMITLTSRDPILMKKSDAYNISIHQYMYKQYCCNVNFRKLYVEPYKLKFITLEDIMKSKFLLGEDMKFSM